VCINIATFCIAHRKLLLVNSSFRLKQDKTALTWAITWRVVIIY